LTPTRLIIKPLLTILASAWLLSLSGCNILGPVFYVVHGPPKVKAQYNLDSEKKTVFFIDDRANRLPRRSLKDVIGQQAEETLIARGAVPQDNMIASRSATIAARGEMNSELMSISAIGRAVGAERVIYVNVEGFSVTRDGTTIEPIAGVVMKVIDVEADRRVWPGDSQGFPVRVQLPATGSTIGADRASIRRVETGLAEMLGMQIARTFFEYERDSLSGSLGD